MRCEIVKKLLLTDCIDSQLTSSVKKQIAAHLKKCNGCRKFLSRMKIFSEENFNLLNEDVPIFIWGNVKNELIKGQTSFKGNQYIFPFFFFKKYQYIFAGVLFLIMSFASINVYKLIALHKTIDLIEDHLVFISSLSSDSGLEKDLCVDDWFIS